MNCEDNLCIYQENGVCTLDKIAINNLGMCTECTHPNIDPLILAQEKKQLLQKYRELDNN